LTEDRPAVLAGLGAFGTFMPTNPFDFVDDLAEGSETFKTLPSCILRASPHTYLPFGQQRQKLNTAGKNSNQRISYNSQSWCYYRNDSLSRNSNQRIIYIAKAGAVTVMIL
jgi:hypothetical protein